jgi:hypothetical protein
VGKRLTNSSKSEEEMRNPTLNKAIILGLIGGFVGTIIMDLVIAGLFLAVGMRVVLIYSFIGDVAQSFFLRMGINAPGGTPLGVFFHFILGLTLGSLFSLLVTQVRALRLTSLKKRILLSILYIEIASQPILVTAPLLIKMTTSDLLQWYGLSTVMHLIYGIVLGVVSSFQQQEKTLTKGAA